MTSALLNSDDIAAVLVASGFTLDSDPRRTKAHAYRHGSLHWPVYVKVDGKAGELRPSTTFPLVVHHADAQRLLGDTPWPDGVRLSENPYKSTGLAAFHQPDQGSTPSGRALAFDSEPALRAFLTLLCNEQARDPLALLDALTAEEYAQALTVHADAISAAQRAMLIGHARAARQRLSMERIALHGGYDNYAAANSQYGRLGRLIATHFNAGGLENQTLALAVGSVDRDDQGHFVWIMRPALAEALRMLGWVSTDAVPLQTLEAVACEIQDEDIERAPTTRQALINARVGQGLFREQLLDIWQGRCAVTGCALRAVLVASHAKAWKDSDDAQRLDPYNGLPLTASIDRLFDQGLISFADDGALLRKPGLAPDELAHLGLRPDARLRTACLHARHLPYLAAHRAAHGF